MNPTRALALTLLAAAALAAGLWISLGTERGAAAAGGGRAAAGAEPASGALRTDEGGDRRAPDVAERAAAVAAEREPHDATTCTVRVVSADDGAPIAGAVVYVQKEDVEWNAWIDAIRRFNDVEAVLALGFGRELESDARGEVRVPRPSEPLAVAAALGASHGEARLRPEEPVCVVELRPYASLVLEVVDRTGGPLADLPVGLYGGEVDPWDLHWEGLTDAAGRAHLLKLEDSVWPRDAPGPFRLALATVSSEPAYVEFARDAPPTEPVRLVAEPTARLVVRTTDPSGRPVAVDGDVSLWNARDPERGRPVRPFDFWSADRPLREGRAEFAHVGLGERIEISVRADGYRHAAREVDGPVRPGDVLTVAVPLVNRQLRAVGRLAKAEGAGSRRGNLHAQLRSGDRAPGFSDWVAVGERFAARVSRRPQPRVAMEPWTFELGRPGGPFWSGRAVPVWSEDGYELDFGDVELTPVPVVVSGRVVDTNEAPLGNARVTVRWSGEALSLPCDEDGRFAVPGGPERLPVELLAREFTHLDGEPLLVTVPRDDVELRLRAAARLRGSLLLPHEAVVDDLELELDVTRADGTLARGAWGTLEYSHGGAFRFDECSPGLGLLEIALDDETLLKLGGIELGSGATTQLDPIDVRPFLRAHRFRVEYEDGAPVRSGHVRGVTEDGVLLDWYGDIESGGRAFLLTTVPRLDVWVAGRGAVPQRFSDVADGDLLVVSRARAVELQVPRGILAEMAPFELWVEVSPARGTRPGGYRNAELTTARVGADGRCVLEVPGPGEYGLRWHLRSAETGYEARLWYERRDTLKIEAETRTVQAAPPIETVRKALAGLR